MRANQVPTAVRHQRERVWAFVLPFALLAGAARAQTASTEPAARPAEPAPALVQAIQETLQDEYRGRAFYQRFLNDHGDLRPFANIVHAEGRHAAMLVALLEARALTAPASRFEPGGALAFGTRQEACAAAVTFERENVALYDKHLTGELPEDVRRVFVHNRDASQYHHLPAFERCAGSAATGGAASQVTRGGAGHGRGHGAGRGHDGHGAGTGCGPNRCGGGHGDPGSGGCGCGHHGRGCRQAGSSESAPHH